jgi:hypothetical protein
LRNVSLGKLRRNNARTNPMSISRRLFLAGTAAAAARPALGAVPAWATSMLPSSGLALRV